MRNIILVVEDKSEEQVIAKKIVLESGKKIIIAGTLEKAEEFIRKFSDKLCGIITDIHFPINDTWPEASANGISVVIAALNHGIPCVVCTDDVAHGARYVALILSRLERLSSKMIPTATSKNWADAMNKLTSLQEEANEDTTCR